MSLVFEYRMIMTDKFLLEFVLTILQKVCSVGVLRCVVLCGTIAKGRFHLI